VRSKALSPLESPGKKFNLELGLVYLALQLPELSTNPHIINTLDQEDPSTISLCCGGLYIPVKARSGSISTYMGWCDILVAWRDNCSSRHLAR